MIMEQFYWRVAAQTRIPPYFGGAGIGLLPALYEASGYWPGAICIDDPASAVAAWIRAQTKSELFCFPKQTSNLQAKPTTMPQGPWDSSTVPTHIGDSERDVMNVHSIAFGFGSSPSTHRDKPLDTLFGIKSGIGFIHLGGLHRGAEVIRGARQLLMASQPAIQIVRDAPSGDKSGLSELTGIAEALADAGYELYDSLLSPCGQPEVLRQSLEGWHESVWFGFPVGYDFEKLLQCFWNDLTSYQEKPVMETSFSASEIVDSSGIYALERWEHLTWRWTGPTPRASIRLPVARPGCYRLRFQLLKVSAPDVLDSLRIFVNGQATKHHVQINEHDIIIEVDKGVVMSLTRFKPIIEILFVHARTHSINSEDPRRLGLALMKIEFERQD